MLPETNSISEVTRFKILCVHFYKKFMYESKAKSVKTVDALLFERSLSFIY